MVSPIIEVRSFTLKKGTFRLSNLVFDVKPKEIFAILGKTGAGKTLLLESIAGFYAGTEGEIYLNGKAVLDIPLTARKIGFVYQDYGLFPHMTVGQNIAYGLRMQKKAKAQIAEEVGRMADILSISHILPQYPGTLSGGEKQRTALARALVLNPDVLLLDEPFSALDPVTKCAMHDVLMKINEQFGCAIVFVTHDFSEAQTMASRIGIMDHGCLKAIRQSDQLFHRYNDDEINQFLGIKGGALYDTAGTYGKAER